MSEDEAPTNAPANLGEARPERIPRPTFWPAALAFGITFLAWSLLTSVVLAAVGALVFAVALAGWVGEIVQEQEGPNGGAGGQ